MEAIQHNNIINFKDEFIFKYQFFQVHRIKNIVSIKEDPSISYYASEYLAKQRQAYELYRLMTGRFKAKNKQEGQAVHFFKRFIYENDIDFCISIVTNHQMGEEEFKQLLISIEETKPELLI